MVPATGGRKSVVSEESPVVPFFVHFQIPALKLERRLTFMVEPKDSEQVLSKAKKCICDLETTLADNLLGAEFMKRVSAEISTFDKCVVHSFQQWQGLVEEWKSNAGQKIYELTEELEDSRRSQVMMEELLEEAGKAMKANALSMTATRTKLQRAEEMAKLAQSKRRADERYMQEQKEKIRIAEDRLQQFEKRLQEDKRGKKEDKKSSGLTPRMAPQVRTNPELPSMSLAHNERCSTLLPAREEAPVKCSSECDDESQDGGDTGTECGSSSGTGTPAESRGSTPTTAFKYVKQRPQSSSSKRAWRSPFIFKRAVSFANPLSKFKAVVPAE